MRAPSSASPINNAAAASPPAASSPLPGSPVIDRGNSSGAPATDQRGVARPRDGDGNGSPVVDIGAFER